MTRARAAALLLAAASARGAAAHDFWIDAAPYRLPAGGVVRVTLHHGDPFLGEPVPRDPARIESFELAGPQGAQAVLGRSGSVTGYARPQAPGLHVISYHAARFRNELPPEAFEAYLREKGLDHAARLRAERGERGRPGREVYSRCAKALVWADGPGASRPGEAAPPCDRALGLPLEIVIEGDPGELRPGGRLAVNLLYRGRALPGATVTAVAQADAARPAACVTDAGGRALFPVNAPGPWIISAVHMVAAPPEARADWESFWASLTLDVPAATNVQHARR